MATIIKLGVQTNSTPNNLGEKIELVGLENIWREGASQTFAIVTPQGYSCYWEIVDSRSFSLYQAGRGNSISTSFPSSADSNGYHQFYDVLVYARKGSRLFSRRWRRGISVLPPTFTEAEADAVWNFSASSSNPIFYNDNNRTNRTNYKIFCKGTYTGASWLGLEEWVSNNASQPVHLMADPVGGATINHSGTNYCLKIVEGKNILLDGCANPANPYGFKFNHTAAGAQSLFIEGARSTTTLANAGGNVRICGVQIDGGNLLAGAGLQHQNANSGATAYGLWDYDGFTVHDCYIKNTVSEGVYLGYNNDGSNYSGITNLVFCRVTTEHTGADGIQFGLCQGEVHDCIVIDAGHRNDPNHRNAIQWNPGNDRMYFYRNICYSSINVFSANMGVKYQNTSEVFSNLFINTRNDVPSNVYLALYQNDFTPTIDFKFHRNTMITPNAPTGTFPFYVAKLNSGITTEFNKLVLANNLIVATTTTQYGTLNSPSFANATVANYLTTNLSTPQFKNTGSNDYHLNSLSSPVFASINKSFSSSHPCSAEDVEGVAYLTDIYGCYSGYELMT